MTKDRVTIIGLINASKGDKKQLNLVYNLVKKHPYFQGERRKIYKLIVKYKNNKGGK